MKLIAVIHVIFKENISRIIKQCKIAFDNGCYGIFLCPAENNIFPEDMNNIFENIYSLFPNKFIGINYMNKVDTYIDKIPDGVSGIWTDKGIGNIDSVDIINKINLIKMKKKFLYFGGFYHKGNNSDVNLSKISDKINKANKLFDVITTSGNCTGIPIDDKILDCIHKNSEKPIALSSGVNSKNIVKYKNKINYALVGTGIEENSDDVDLINFYREAMLPDPVKVGYLDRCKIKNIINLINN